MSTDKIGEQYAPLLVRRSIGKVGRQHKLTIGKVHRATRVRLSYRIDVRRAGGLHPLLREHSTMSTPPRFRMGYFDGAGPDEARSTQGSLSKAQHAGYPFGQTRREDRGAVLPVTRVAGPRE